MNKGLLTVSYHLFHFGWRAVLGVAFVFFSAGCRSEGLVFTLTPTASAQPFSSPSASPYVPLSISTTTSVDPPRITLTPSPLPRTATPTPNRLLLLPDSEVVYSPSAVDFDIEAYLSQANGYLKDYREYLKSTGWTSAAQIIHRVALENSINPRLLLALLEYHSGCVYGMPSPDVQTDYLLGNTDFRRQGLFRQLSWASARLNAGYYGWRGGTLHTLTLNENLEIPLLAELNAGSVALQHFYAFYGDEYIFHRALDFQTGLPAVYRRMFGDPWSQAALVEPLVPPGLTQPALILPFEPGRMWAFTSGPHVAWETEGALAALDFAPATYESGCVETDAWVTAMADGLIVRSSFGVVVLDLAAEDGTPSDGYEQTGWSILYMHVAEADRIALGSLVKVGERLGKPSCEGGRATGTHIHIARKYNGEWILADGAIPFDLEGWIAHAGTKPYEGTLTRHGIKVVAHPYGSYETKIFRPLPTPTPAP